MRARKYTTLTESPAVESMTTYDRFEKCLNDLGSIQEVTDVVGAADIDREAQRDISIGCTSTTP